MAGYSVTFSVVDEATKTLEAISRRIQQMRAPIERQQRELSRIIDASGLKKVASGFGDVASAAGTAFSSLARIVPVLGTITGAASLAGMAKLVESTAAWAQALQLDSSYINTTTQRLQTLQNATRLVGGTTDQMTGALKDLARASADALTTDPAKAQFFARAHIALRDQNGQLRTATDLLPETIDYINSLGNAQDRESEALRLGGRSLFTLAEQYRLAGKSMKQAEADAAKYGSLTKEQIEDLHAFHSAMSEVNVAFNRLAEDMGAAMAPYLTPVLKWMSEFVRTHKPAVVAALEAIGAAVTVLGGLFAAKLGIKAVSAVADLTLSIGTMGGAITKALGPLAALWAAYEGAKAVIADPGNIAPGAGLWKSFQNILKGKAPWAEGYFPTDKNPLAPGPAAAPAGTPAASPAAPPAGVPLDLGGNPAAPPAARGPGRMGGMAPSGGMTATPASYTPPAAATATAPLTPNTTANVAGPAKAGSLYQQRAGAIVEDLQGSLGLTREQASGLVGNLGYESAGFKSLQEGRPISGRGGLGYGQWTGSRRVDFEKWSAQQGLDPHSHEANVGFLKHELTGKYAGFLAHLKQTGSIEESSRLTHKEFETPADVIPKYFGTRIGSRTITPYMTGPDRLRYARQAAGLAAAAPPQQAAAPAAAMPAQASGAPAQVTGGPPVSGSVDVNITHRNPPPGATVTASAAGAGINLNPPRIEQQQLQNV